MTKYRFYSRQLGFPGYEIARHFCSPEFEINNIDLSQYVDKLGNEIDKYLIKLIEDREIKNIINTYKDWYLYESDVSLTSMKMSN